jgi:guanyl-specific ribonuclease Sa
MRQSRIILILVAVLLGMALNTWRIRQAPSSPAAQAPSHEVTQAAPAADDGLPAEAHDTLARIAAGGPFPYDRDGVVFANFEHRLPEHPRGWYHEYTVPTPGVGHRGARRIVTGGNPPVEWYYTDDHYQSFQRIEGGQ